MTAQSQRRTAGLALVACLIWLGLPLAGIGHRGFDDDTACGPDMPGIPRAAAIQAATTVTPLQHCAICHLQRAARGARPAAPAAVTVNTYSTIAVVCVAAQPLASTPLDHQPARAPPSSLFS